MRDVKIFVLVIEFVGQHDDNPGIIRGNKRQVDLNLFFNGARLPQEKGEYWYKKGNLIITEH